MATGMAQWQGAQNLKCPIPQSSFPSEVLHNESKWEFKRRTKAYGSIERYKARFVTKGYWQVKEVDYGETYSPVDRYLMAAVAKLGLKIHQLDAVTASL